MHRPERSQKLLLAYSSLMALVSLLVWIWIISSPSEPGNAILFGFSATRLVMIAGLLGILSFYTIIAVRTIKDRGWANRFFNKWFIGQGISQGIVWLSVISLGLGWIGCFLPVYRLGEWGKYWERAQSSMVFVMMLFVGLATLIMFIVVQSDRTLRDLNLKQIKLGLPLFSACLLVFGLMFYSGFGVASQDDFWYGAGVPVLVSQLIMAIIGGIIIFRFEYRWQSRRAEIFICFLLYVSTAFLWAHEPLRESFLFTGPAPLNNGYFPFADAAIFDAASQFALVGEKFFIFNGYFFERPLYLGFLVYLHSLFGQNYEMLMAGQAAVFAILPMLIYLIGRSLGFRSAGFSAALVAMFRGVNAIAASNMIDMASPKMILTDFPTAIGIALIVLTLCEWLKDPEKNRRNLAWVGGAIGCTLMLRTNALLLVVFIPCFVLFIYSHDWKKWLTGSCLVIFGVVAITLPWEMRNLSVGGQMYSSIVTKIQNVIDSRYHATFQPESFLPADQGFSSAVFLYLQPISTLYSETDAIQDPHPCDSIVCFSSNHFLHNVITSILIMPTSPVLDDLRHLIKDRYPYYWKVEWDGTFTDIAPLFLILNLFLITTGIALTWREKRWRGLIPFLIFMVYNISNGLARTSGGRYIVPMDWIVPLYYFIGVFYIITWLGNAIGTQWKNVYSESEPVLSKRISINQFSKTLFVFVALLGLGSLIPLSENLYQPRYRNTDPMDILVTNKSAIQDGGLNFEETQKILEDPNASLFVGRALYPRYYEMDQGEISFGFYPYVTMGFPRTGFKVIGPEGEQSVVLAGNVPQHFPHASDVLVLGCKGQNYVDALVVLVLDENGKVYMRKPASELKCPFSEPVCTSNSVCQ